MSVASWKEGNKDLCKVSIGNHPGTKTQNKAIFVFSPAVVQLEVQNRRPENRIIIVGFEMMPENGDCSVGVMEPNWSKEVTGCFVCSMINQTHQINLDPLSQTHPAFWML